MNRRNLLTFATWTFASFAVASAGMLTARLQATPDEAAQQTQPPAPVLKSGPAEIALKLAPDSNLIPGATPVFIVEARNTSDEATTVIATVTVLGTQPTNPMSRALPRSTQVWQKKLEIALSPKGSQTLRISPDQPLPQASLSVTVAVDKQTIIALRSTMPAPGLTNQLRAPEVTTPRKLATIN
ncbi:MAG: hypothetical protein ABSH20_06275 [Tepidisphaeraceae bacterium]|jgi:hypothetical protein